MKRILPLAASVLTLLLAGCLTTPVADSGGPGAVTVPNTNVDAIIAAAQPVFASAGYTAGPANYPSSVSFDKPSGAFGKILYGSYGTTTTVRAKLRIAQISNITNDYRISVSVTRVSNAGEAGFESSSRMLGVWSAEYGPLLKQISEQAANAGPM